jgi:archaellum component FlaC
VGVWGQYPQRISTVGSRKPESNPLRPLSAAKGRGDHVREAAALWVPLVAGLPIRHDPDMAQTAARLELYNSLRRVLGEANAESLMSYLPPTGGAELATRSDIESLRGELDGRFGVVDTRFEQIDHRFEQIDHRFEQIDRRFEQIDRRFEQIDRRFELVFSEFAAVRAEMAAESKAIRQEMAAGFATIRQDFTELMLAQGHDIHRRIDRLFIAQIATMVAVVGALLAG